MRDTGGPAFPGAPEGWNVDGTVRAYGGMTLRDFFAAAALQGIISAMEWRSTELCISAVIEQVRGGAWEARAAYAYADAMLAERDNP